LALEIPLGLTQPGQRVEVINAFPLSEELMTDQLLPSHALLPSGEVLVVSFELELFEYWIEDVEIESGGSAFWIFSNAR
jgi:hypothetical protein